MRKREWALLLIVYLALTELLSLHPVPDLSLCLMQSESAEPPANDDDEKYCPAFHAGVVAALEAIDGMLESHDKSVVAGFTVILALSTIGLWLATRKLWEAGEKQLEFLRQSTLVQSKDMQASIAVAQQSADAAKLAAAHVPKTERAYLFLELNIESNIENLFSLYPDETRRRAEVKFGFRNHGRTPAIVQSLHVAARYWDKMQMPSMAATRPLVIQPGVIISDEPVGGYVADFDLAREDWRDLTIANRGYVMFWGKIVYLDVFQETHEAGWCRVNPCDGRGWLFGGDLTLNYYT